MIQYLSIRKASEAENDMIMGASNNNGANNNEEVMIKEVEFMSN